MTGSSPLAMIVLPPRHYLEVENPVKRDEKGELEVNKFGEVEIKHGEVEIRFHENYSEPFPLYYREKMLGAVKKLTVVKENDALKVEAVRNFEDKKIGD